MPRITLKLEGVKETTENMMAFNKEYRENISRISLRAMTMQILDAVRSQTYTTFTQRTGLIKSGLGVRTSRLKGDVVISFVVENPQRTINMGKVAFKSVARRPRARALPPVQWRAFYWRFLELGTNKRADSRGANRGEVSSHAWLTPTFKAVLPAALQHFAKVQKRMVDEAVSKLPKTRS